MPWYYRVISLIFPQYYRAITAQLIAENEQLRSRLQKLEEAVASAPSPEKRVAEDEAKAIYFGRPSYAQAQAQWEFDHNRRAREIADRQREGFF